VVDDNYTAVKIVDADHAVFLSRPVFGFDAFPQRTDCTSTGGLVAPGFGAGPDTNRSAGLHSLAAVATEGAAQG
jgi:hypothetical protein